MIKLWILYIYMGSGGARNSIKPGHNFNRKCTYIFGIRFLDWGSSISDRF
jgi:hypothetical protein